MHLHVIAGLRFVFLNSFVVSVEHTPMWSSLLCLSIIRHKMIAEMICSLIVNVDFPTPVSTTADAPRLPLLGDRWSVWLNRAVWVTVCVTQCVGLWWSGGGSMNIGVSCTGRCPCQAERVFVWVCGRVCVDTRLWACCAGRWHYCIAGPPWLTGGRTRRRWEKGRKKDVSQRQGEWGRL